MSGYEIEISCQRVLFHKNENYRLVLISSLLNKANNDIYLVFEGGIEVNLNDTMVWREKLMSSTSVGVSVIGHINDSEIIRRLGDIIEGVPISEIPPAP